MSSNVELIKIKTFCDLFKEFLNDLVSLHPNDSSLVLLKTTITLLSATTPKLLVSQFMEYTTPYKDKILNKDESFFLNNLQNDIQDESYSWINDEINKVKYYWPETSQDTKDKIWKYFQAFIKLGNSIMKS